MAGLVDQIKERIGIVDVVGQRVNLRRSGRSFKALCPFHAEKTPSFYVFPESGTFKCFGCGVGGDVFTFLMKADNLEFGEALKILAERAGVNLRPAPEVAAEDATRAHLRGVLNAAAIYFHNLLLRANQAQQAREYLAKRGVSQATVEGWQLGYAPHSWDALQGYMLTRGYTIDDLAAAGLVVARESGGYYDRFRNRIMFPIHDARGTITGFGARALGDDMPKYLNSPQSILFDKSATLYGIEHARESIRQTGQAVIVEGYMDVLIPHQMGMTNIVASLGTALTPKQIEQLKRLGKTLILALDADAAGDEATLRGLDVARDVLDREAVPVPTWRGLIRFEHVLQTEIRVLALPRGKDPDEVVLEDPEEWKRLVLDALPVLDFSFNAVTARLDLRNPKDKAAAVDRLLPIIAGIGNDVIRSHYLQKLANLVQVDERTLSARLRTGRQPAGRRTAPTPSAPKRQPQRPPLDDYCLAMLLYEPSLYWKTEELHLSAEDFPGTQNQQIFAAFDLFMREHGVFDLSAFRVTLDETLQPHLDELSSMSSRQPLTNGEELETAFTVAVLRGRQSRLHAEISQITHLLRDVKQDEDESSTTTLMSRVHMLSEELGQIDKQLDQRTILWRTRGEA